jgi:hypothetical protein
MENEQLTEQQLKQTNVGGRIEKVVPKFCTGIGLDLLNNTNVIMTMNYDDGFNLPILIDRVIVDIGLIKIIKNACENIIREVENDNK